MCDNKKRCRHYNGYFKKSCEAGVEYDAVKQDKLYPCMGETETCSSLSFLTDEEIATEEAEIDQAFDLIKQGLSPCCKAPLDESEVITEGKYKGHGKRYCSKCRQFVYGV